jgi:hypothetical protein
MEQREYVRRLLEAYRQTHGTCGVVRRADRLLAAQLHERGVPLETVENALVLAAARRLMRPTDAAPLGTIRSLAYFSSVIDEVLQMKVSQEYFRYVRQKAPTRRPCAIEAPPIPERNPQPMQRAFGADETAVLPPRTNN